MNVIPMKRIASRTAIAIIVLAAFFASGGLNAGTPLAIASVPVRATEPLANAFSSRKMPMASVPAATASVWTMSTAWPVTTRNVPMPTISQGEADEQVGRDGEDVAGLAQAAQVGRRDQDDRDHADLDPEVVERRDDRVRPGRSPTPSRRRRS